MLHTVTHSAIVDSSTTQTKGITMSTETKEKIIVGVVTGLCTAMGAFIILGGMLGMIGFLIGYPMANN